MVTHEAVRSDSTTLSALSWTVCLGTKCTPVVLHEFRSLVAVLLFQETRAGCVGRRRRWPCYIRHALGRHGPVGGSHDH
jgi:hypothetical protein